MALNVTKLVPHAIVPTRSSPGAAGLDIYASDGYLLLPGHRVVVSTGISIQLPPGTFGRLASRSGLAVKHGLAVGAEIIDPDYIGELKVVLFNHDTRNPFVIRPGYRIAQLIVMPLATTDVSVIDAEPLLD
jgi:dUTP pyrophosphatase